MIPPPTPIYSWKTNLHHHALPIILFEDDCISYELQLFYINRGSCFADFFLILFYSIAYVTSKIPEMLYATSIHYEWQARWDSIAVAVVASIASIAVHALFFNICISFQAYSLQEMEVESRGLTYVQ